MAACVEAKERRSERLMLIARKKKITEEKDEGMKFNLGCRGGEVNLWGPKDPRHRGASVKEKEEDQNKKEKD